MDKLFTNDIFIDSETLIYNIKRDEKMFVQTRAYDKAVEILNKYRTLFIIGNPGVGKTITSEMIVLYYISMGYRVRFTTDGTNIATLKKSLSADKNAKEIILLDDCFGQAYFKIKETQNNELVYLIQSVNFSSNKLLILNSRVSIYNDAKNKSIRLLKCLENDELKVHIIDVSELAMVEKARILYNHMYFNGIPKDYYAQIKVNKNYEKIISHRNYNPRVIEYVCAKQRYRDVPNYKYFGFIMDCLDKPNGVWEDEYENRLDNTDRILMGTMFSLTETTVAEKTLEYCFNYRLSRLQYDKTINHFKNAIERLNGTMLGIVDVKGEKSISVSNPSINDFMRNRMKTNPLEFEEIINSAIHIMQLKKMLSEEECERRIASIIQSGDIISYYFRNSKERIGCIAYYVCKHELRDSRYQEVLESYLSDPFDINLYDDNQIEVSKMLMLICRQAIVDYYGLRLKIYKLITETDVLETIEVSELVNLIKTLTDYYGEASGFAELCKKSIINSANATYGEADTDEYIERSDINEAIENNATSYRELDFDADGAAEELKTLAEGRIYDYIENAIFDLPDEVHSLIDVKKDIHIYAKGTREIIESLVDTYDYENDDYRYESDRGDTSNEIDYIFDR